jgi:hypothetical protein
MEAMLEAGVGRFRGPSLAAMLAEMWAPLAVALAALATLPSLLGRLQVLILRDNSLTGAFPDELLAQLLAGSRGCARCRTRSRRSSRAARWRSTSSTRSRSRSCPSASTWPRAVSDKVRALA